MAMYIKISGIVEFLLDKSNSGCRIIQQYEGCPSKRYFVIYITNLYQFLPYIDKYIIFSLTKKINVILIIKYENGI